LIEKRKTQVLAFIHLFIFILLLNLFYFILFFFFPKFFCF